MDRTCQSCGHQADVPDQPFASCPNCGTPYPAPPAPASKPRPPKLDLDAIRQQAKAREAAAAEASKSPLRKALPWIVFGILGIGLLTGHFSLFGTSGDKRTAGERHWSAAAYPCKQAIEREARFGVEWIGGALSSHLSRYETLPDGRIRYVGDQVRLQNGFGAWERHSYACTFDPTTGAVDSVSLRPGVLPD